MNRLLFWFCVGCLLALTFADAPAWAVIGFGLAYAFGFGVMARRM